MVSVNLLPWRLYQQRRIVRHSLLVLGSVLMVLFVVTTFFFFAARAQQQQLRLQIEGLQAAAMQTDQQLQLQQQAMDELQQLSIRWQHYQRQQHQAQQWLVFFNRLGNLMPATLWLTQLERSPDRLIFAGQSYAMQEIAMFRQQLELQPLLQNVQLGNITRLESGELNFQIEASLQKAENDG